MATGDEASDTAAADLARAAGVPVALVSNSLGRDCYARVDLDELFDVTVISGQVGVRKPSRRIYAIAADRLGLAPEQCVMVDDLEEALAEAVAPGSPAWERDSATGPGGGEVELPSYRVSDLQAVPGMGTSGLVLTASVAQGSDGDPVPVRLVLEAADGAGAGRLVDWMVLSAAEDAPTDG